MYPLFVQLHSYLRYFVLFFLLVTIIRTFYFWQKSLPFNKQTDKLNLYLFICTHLQLVLGLVLYTISPNVNLSHMKAAMKDPIYRFWTVEHITLMLVAIVFITIARISMKKITTDTGKHKRLFIFNFIALILILGAIPWPHTAVGAGRHFLFGWF